MNLGADLWGIRAFARRTLPTRRNDQSQSDRQDDRGGRVKGEPVVLVAFPSSASVSDADLKVLKELTSLKTLNLDSTNITDEGLKELKEFATLESLTLSNTKITDAGLKELKYASIFRSRSSAKTCVIKQFFLVHIDPSRALCTTSQPAETQAQTNAEWWIPPDGRLH